MVDSKLMEFFDPIIDDDLSRMILKLIAENQNEENFEKILEKILKLIEKGEFCDKI
jgi:hypothetical protein